MNKLKLFTVVLFLCSHLFAASIGGTVTNANTGEAIEGVTIELMSVMDDSSANPVIYETQSASDGKYLFSDIVAGYYQLNIYETQEYEAFYCEELFDIKENSVINDFDIQLVPINKNGDLVSLNGYVWASDSSSGVMDSTGVHPVYPATIELISLADSALTSYTVENNPDGSYRIENITPGMYSVTCSADGYPTQVISDFPLYDTETYLDIWMSTSPDPIFGVVSGRVVFDEEGTPAPDVLVELIPADGYYGFNNYTYTDEQGYYSVEAVPGSYYLSCTSFTPAFGYDSTAFDSAGYNYYQEFYDNVHSISEATLIKVVKNDTVANLDFGIPKVNKMGEINITGTVYDAEGQPLEGASVQVWLDGGCINYNSPEDSLECGTMTDANGRYSITFDNSIFYAFNAVVSAQKDGYKIEFYQEKNDFYQADPIPLYNQTQITNIDFTLDVDTVSYQNSISGQLFTEDATPPDMAFVISFNLNTSDLYFTGVAQDGTYRFEQVTSGQYIVLFVASGFIPEFYEDAYTWEEATPVNVSGDVTGINATLETVMPDSSLGHVAGNVTDQNNKPVNGVLMVAKNSMGKIVGYDFTSSSGSYNINGLGNGTYTVVASKVEYASESQTIRSDLSVNATTLNNIKITQKATAIEGPVTKLLPAANSLDANYPNPFNPTTTIRYRLAHKGKVRLTVYASTGQRIYTWAETSQDAGVHQVRFNAKGLASGIYFYTLMVDGKLVNTRKMLLVR